MAEIHELPRWRSFTDVMPDDGAMVRVSSENWDETKLLRFHQSFARRDGLPALHCEKHDRWYWYPERMKWRSDPLPQG